MIHSSTYSVHLLLGERLLHVASEVVDHVASLEHALVHGVVVVKGDEGKAAWLVRRLVGDDLDLEVKINKINEQKFVDQNHAGFKNHLGDLSKSH